MATIVLEEHCIFGLIEHNKAIWNWNKIFIVRIVADFWNFFTLIEHYVTLLTNSHWSGAVRIIALTEQQVGSFCAMPVEIGELWASWPRISCEIVAIGQHIWEYLDVDTLSVSAQIDVAGTRIGALDASFSEDLWMGVLAALERHYAIKTVKFGIIIDPEIHARVFRIL